MEFGKFAIHYLILSEVVDSAFIQNKIEEGIFFLMQDIVPVKTLTSFSSGLARLYVCNRGSGDLT